jgi:hypothetical protein
MSNEVTPDEIFNHGSEITHNVIDPGRMAIRAQYAIQFGAIKGVARAHMTEDGSRGYVEVEIHDSPIGEFRMTLEAPRETVENARDFAAAHNVIPKVTAYLEKQFGTRPVIQHLLSRG